MSLIQPKLRCQPCGANPGRPVCVVVHGWDCGAAAKRLLPANQFLFGGRVGQEGLADVICTAEVGEDLFQFVRR